MMRILFDSRWIAPHGIGRVAREYRDRMVRDFDVTELREGPKPSHPMDWWFLARAFRRSGADLLFVPGYNGTPLVGRRQIFIIHDLIHFGKAEPNGMGKRLYYNTVTRMAARLGNLITVSEESANALAQRWPETRGRANVVPNGIADTFMSAGPVGNASRWGLVLFGNGRWHKNLGGMLEAIALWQRRAPEGKFVPITIIGADEPARGLAQAAGVRSPFFAGQLSDDEAAGLFTHSSGLLFCSHVEGFGLPLLEAVACGCPVIASDIPVLREIGEAGCIFVDQLSPQAIADGIDRAFKMNVDEKARTALIEKHYWDRSYDKIAAYIRALGATLNLA